MQFAKPVLAKACLPFVKRCAPKKSSHSIRPKQPAHNCFNNSAAAYVGEIHPSTCNKFLRCIKHSIQVEFHSMVTLLIDIFLPRLEAQLRPRLKQRGDIAGHQRRIQLLARNTVTPHFLETNLRTHLFGVVIRGLLILEHVIKVLCYLRSRYPDNCYPALLTRSYFGVSLRELNVTLSTVI